VIRSSFPPHPPFPLYSPSCVSGVNYLSDPRQVFAEMHRVLRSGGMAVVAFSNRSFLDKTIAVWKREIYDSEGQVHIVRDMFQYSVERKSGFRDITGLDITPRSESTSGGGEDGESEAGDPLWVVTAIKV
jgi:SAM-dependent methyltransferase